LSTQPVKGYYYGYFGFLIPSQTFEFISKITAKYPNIHFDFHAHNDYDLSIAMETIKAGIKGTCYGKRNGERAGNAPLESTVAVINDFMPEIKINVNESSYSVSKLVETFTGYRIPANKPIVGDNVFTQTSIHADGDNKNLYFNDLLPERFGRKDNML
jgi:D-citramalate synthase